MRNLILIFVICFSLFAVGQKKKKLSIEAELIANFRIVKKIGVQNVIEFKVNDKTGFVSKSGLIELIAPKLNYFQVNSTFKNIFEYNYLNKNYKHNIETGLLETTRLFGFNGFLMDKPMKTNSYSKAISSENGFIGFTVKENKIETYSDIYKYYNEDEENIELFKFENKFYAIVTNKLGKEGIIKENGEILPFFDFNSDNLIFNSCANESNTLWFLTAVNGKGSFISLKGECKLKDELFSIIFPTYFQNGLGCMLIENDNGFMSAVVDFVNMIWIIKPQNQIKFNEIVDENKKQFNNYKFDYSLILTKFNFTDKENKKYYIKVKEKNCEYFMDQDFKKYIPAKYLK